ncbi:two pore calcium channel protein 2-like [Colossoma macropomum]|uniref:two pore calcium channel protein 2-like n=1 Tax=Colossoma macropomum TaxID=42526 RepID=UPI001863D118|nr:two pore calcium channel protein 2-like [Colossoma macropomum]
MLCLLFLTLDLSVKFYLVGWEEFWRCKWLMGYMLVILLSAVDWTVAMNNICEEHNLHLRRILRPFFLLQNSSLMKKTLKCIKMTLPQIASVVLLLILHLALFTIFGMLLFARGEDSEVNAEWESYFRDLPQSLTSLLVLLTTTNNPDVMIPAYSTNRLYSLFFILYSGFGTYFLMHLLTAVIYNQFRGYLLLSIKASILRRRMGIRAAFELLSTEVQPPHHSEAKTETARVKTIVKVMKRVKMSSYYRQAIIKRALRSYSGLMERDAFQALFEELDKDRLHERPAVPLYSSRFLSALQRFSSSKTFSVLTNTVALANVVCIFTMLVIDSHKTPAQRERHYTELINCFFVACYVSELAVKLVAAGWRRFLSFWINIFDSCLTLLLLALQVYVFALMWLPSSSWSSSQKGLLSLWETARLMNMLVVFRFLRVILNIKLMALVASTVLDLVKNLRAFAGILVVVYYVFAVLGVWLFKGAITAPANISSNINTTKMKCGSYEQLGYWSNNFDDFASALVLLYNIMVLNNWQVYLQAYSKSTSEWSKIYFICWWLTSSVMWVNLLVALILENFIYKWDRRSSSCVSDSEGTDLDTPVQRMFREHIQEPSEEEVVTKLNENPHLHLTL